jgi:propionate CoA-transferase
MSKILTARQAVEQIKDGDFLVSSGFQLITVAEELAVELERRFLETGSPKNLTFMHAAGQGRNARADIGLPHYAHEGLIKRYITGHFAANKAMQELAVADKIEAYNLPQGVICQLYRCTAGGKKGELTKVGLKTFVDPRMGGAKLTPRTKEDIVHLVTIAGEEYLFYDAPKIDVAFVKGTTADEFGNITMEEECAPIDSLDVALAAKASGGKVFVQVKNYVSSSSLSAKNVVIPGVLVDGIVVTSDPAKYHPQTPGAFYDPLMAGIYKSRDGSGFKPIPLDERKVIARRAAMELEPASPVNLGIGVPECVGSVAAEEGVAGELILTIENGIIGGMPIGGDHFGSAINHWAALPMGSQFDFYNGGNLKAAFLGFFEIGASGDVNSSKMGPTPGGCGGFIDISQFTPKMIFTGTLTAGGLEVAIENGKLKIVKEGKKKKFLNKVAQITYSAEVANKTGQRALVVTERCVFRVTGTGLVLIEVADGIDIEKDIIANMEFRPTVADDVKKMDPRLFLEAPIGLREIILAGKKG